MKAASLKISNILRASAKDAHNILSTTHIKTQSSRKHMDITWKLDSILQGQTTEQLTEELKKKVKLFTSYKEKLDACTPETLLQAIKEKEAINVLASRIGAYYGLRLAENTQDADMLAQSTKFDQEMSDLSNELLFFPLWFMHLDDEQAATFLQAESLKDYHYYLESIRKDKPFTKSEEVEKIITIKSITGGSATRNLYDIFTNAFTYDFNGQSGLTREEVAKHVQGTDPQLRTAAYQALMSKYAEHDTLLAEMYKNIVLDWNNEGVKIRGHKNAIDVRDFANDIENEAVQALLEVIKEKTSVFTEYFALKYRLNKQQGQDYPFERYHLYAPYQAKEGAYSYEEAKKIVLETYKEFSEAFHDAAKAIFDAAHVHAFPKKNKRGGAFCYSIHTEEIPFILLNHVGTTRDLFTMMHEFGHGIHGMLSRIQNNMNYDTAIPMAETASIFGEMLLAEKMLSQTADEEKKAILVHLLDNEYASIGRQAYFVLFEEAAHELIQQGATKEALDNAYMAGLKEQFGEMSIAEEFKQEWHYIPHIHASPFYCYAYSWGNLLVLSLFEQFKEQGDAFKEKFTKFLAAGGKDKPAALLATLGIDPKDKEFWRGGFKVIETQVQLLKDLV